MARIRALSAAMTRGEYPDLPAKLKKPVSFIAACHELARADQIGPDFITHLPMSFDAKSAGPRCAVHLVCFGRS